MNGSSSRNGMNAKTLVALIWMLAAFGIVIEREVDPDDWVYSAIMIFGAVGATIFIGRWMHWW